MPWAVLLLSLFPFSNITLLFIWFVAVQHSPLFWWLVAVAVVLKGVNVSGDRRGGGQTDDRDHVGRAAGLLQVPLSRPQHHHPCLPQHGWLPLRPCPATGQAKLPEDSDEVRARRGE